MPPKRKASSSILNESPAKRSARSTKASTGTSSEPTETSARATRSSGKLDNTPSTPVTPRRIIKTYGKQGSTHRRAQAAESLKENEKVEEVRRSEEKDSADELDMLSPTTNTKKRSIKQPLLDSSETSTLIKRTRSGKLPETPVRKQPNRGEAKPKHRSQTPPLTSEATSRLVGGTSTTPRGSRRVSPRKKPPTATDDGNIDHRTTPLKETRVQSGTTFRHAETPQKLPDGKQRVQESDTSPSKKRKTTPNPESSSEATIDRPSSPVAERSALCPAPLKFDAVLIPPAPTPIKTRLRPRDAFLAQTPDLFSDEPPSNALPSSSTPPIDHEPESSGLTPCPSPSASPTKRKGATISSSARVPPVLPRHLHACLNAQKRTILRATQHPPDVASDYDDDDDEPSTNALAAQQLTGLLDGTITRGEGNSCLVLGPRGSGKSRLVEQCIARFAEDKPLVLRLSGWTQHSDRLAMREIAYQLRQEMGASFPSQGDEAFGEYEMADDDSEEAHPVLEGLASTKTTPAAHLPALISLLPTLSRPVIVLLDGFDLFTLHPRQALLYCLLDTAQSCRAAAGTKGLAVIGVTSRIDTIVHLEKRVKSRFSGRMIRTAPPRTLQAWEQLTRAILSSRIDEFLEGHEDTVAEWDGMWGTNVEQFLQDGGVRAIWNDTFSITRDVRKMTRMLLSAVLRLSPSSPSLSSSHFASIAAAQRVRPRFPLLHTLPYPEICLLIASVHADTAGQPIFTFEMLHECFRDQVRASTSAPVQVRGGSIGMVRCSRQVLMAAFENLVVIKAFVAVAAHTQSVAKEFIKYRSAIEREDVRRAVDKMSQVNLKKWLTKAAQ
ncbi:hypothetical protein DXG01_008428 [Tephrocybe rancida]|nr:hypothetical protein DXG01_008428 [Tephrocybe rancida]